MGIRFVHSTDPGLFGAVTVSTPFLNVAFTALSSISRTILKQYFDIALLQAGQFGRDSMLRRHERPHLSALVRYSCSRPVSCGLMYERKRCV